MDDAEDLLFSGLKVLDVGTWIAGPVAGTILADFGADVIKVETPGVGDAYRGLSGGIISPQAPGVNYCWIADGRNKRSITLDLRTAEGREALLDLVRQADIYITNQPFPTRRKFGLMYEDLEPLNPKLIYASLTAYGELGPDAENEGFDGVAWWARTGLMDMVRARGVTPGGSVPGMGDHPTAVTLYASILMALMRRERTGKGSKVHTSLLANGLWANTCYVQAALVGADFGVVRAERPPSPNRTLFETSDGRLLYLYMVRTMDELDRLFVAVSRADLLADPRFEADARVGNLAALVDELKATFIQRTAAEWMATFEEAGVPVVLVARMEDIPHDPQLRPNNIIVPPADPSVPAEVVINHPLNIDGLPRMGVQRAPEIGEHTAEVLRELGYDAPRIRAITGS